MNRTRDTVGWGWIRCGRAAVVRAAFHFVCLLCFSEVECLVRAAEPGNPLGCEGGFGIGGVTPADPGHDSKFSPLAAVGRPPVVSRTNWGCPEGQGSRWTPHYTTVTHLVVHHSAGSNSSADWAATVRGIWSFHTRPVSEGGRGWGDVGYNYLIDPNGVIYEGRAGGDDVIAAHFSCRNGGTMGVCLLGDFTSVNPSDAALESLKQLLAWKAAQRELDAVEQGYHAGSGLLLPRVCGHRDGNAGYPEETCTTTSCPGDRLYSMLPAIRSEVQRRVENATLSPTLNVLGVTEVTDATARLWGRVLTEGGSDILERRIEWGPAGGTLTRWTTAVTVNGSMFHADAGNLNRDTTYEFRASARNSVGWSSSERMRFRTRTLLAPAVTDAERTVEVRGQPGSLIVLQRSINLLEWDSVTTNAIPEGGGLRINVDPVAGAGSFYRAARPVED